MQRESLKVLLKININQNKQDPLIARKQCEMYPTSISKHNFINVKLPSDYYFT